MLAEDDGAVAVGLEVDADVELCSGVVQPLYAGGGADYREAERLLDVLCAGSVGVGGLDDADFEIIAQLCIASEVTDEGCG